MNNWYIQGLFKKYPPLSVHSLIFFMIIVLWLFSSLPVSQDAAMSLVLAFVMSLRIVALDCSSLSPMDVGGWSFWMLCTGHTHQPSLDISVHSHTLLKTHYTHTEQVNVNSDHFRSLHPQQTNHNPLFFLSAYWQHCSHVHRPNETNMVQYRHMMFWNVSSQVSVLTNVSSLAYSCSKRLKSLLHETT